MKRRTNIKDQKTTTKTAVLMLIAGIPMLAGSLFFAYLITQAFLERLEMESWDIAPASLKEVDLKSKTSTSTSGGSFRTLTTFNIKVGYSYRYNNRDYEGTRLNILTLSENFTSYFEDKTKELASYIERGKPVMCFVNPQSPEQSTLLRDGPVYQIGLCTAFAFVFFMIGIAALTGALVFMVEKITGEKSLASRLTQSGFTILASIGFFWIVVPISYFAWLGYQENGASAQTFWLVLPAFVVITSISPLFTKTAK